MVLPTSLHFTRKRAYGGIKITVAVRIISDCLIAVVQMHFIRANFINFVLSGIVFLWLTFHVKICSNHFEKNTQHAAIYNAYIVFYILGTYFLLQPRIKNCKNSKNNHLYECFVVSDLLSLNENGWHTTERNKKETKNGEMVDGCAENYLQ